MSTNAPRGWRKALRQSTKSAIFSYMDMFTQCRLLKFVTDFQARSGTAPTLKDFENAGFERSLVEAAAKDELLEVFYVTLTNGSIVKTYRLHFSA